MVYIVQVHMPHKTISVPFDNEELARQYLNQLIDECSARYGPTDMHGATLDFCKEWGRYEIFNGYHIQMYPATMNKTEEIKWL